MRYLYDIITGTALTLYGWSNILELIIKAIEYFKGI